MQVLGVDPGVGGGSVLLDNLRPVTVLKYTTELDFIEMVRAMVDEGLEHAYIEKVNAFPGQGVASTWKFAENFGLERGVLRSFGVALHQVTPQTWQKALGVKRRGGKTKTQHKNALKDMAARLLPSGNWTLATCDAALIALYGLEQLRKMQGKSPLLDPV